MWIRIAAKSFGEPRSRPLLCHSALHSILALFVKRLYSWRRRRPQARPGSLLLVPVVLDYQESLILNHLQLN